MLKKDFQMSETLLIAAILSISGGLQDVYSYFLRGEVFANAQTGNIVLMSVNLVRGNYGEVMMYFIPLCAFAAGIFIAEVVHRKFHESEKMHWRQIILFFEALILIFVAFIPHRYDTLANAIVSFTCAMQVQTFRKVNGKAYASTMCIGNIRSCMESLCAYVHTHDKNILHTALKYLFVIGMFALGCAFGGMVTAHFGLHSIWVSSGLLLIACLLLFIKPIEAERKGKK